jgi:hypothetical protein
MARSPLDPHHFPFQRKRKTPKGHDERSVGPTDGSDATDRVSDADEADFVYGPAEAEEDDRGLH